MEENIKTLFEVEIGEDFYIYLKEHGKDAAKEKYPEEFQVFEARQKQYYQWDLEFAKERVKVQELQNSVYKCQIVSSLLLIIAGLLNIAMRLI